MYEWTNKLKNSVSSYAHNTSVFIYNVFIFHFSFFLCTFVHIHFHNNNNSYREPGMINRRELLSMKEHVTNVMNERRAFLL